MLRVAPGVHFSMHVCLSRPKDFSLRSFSVSFVNATVTRYRLWTEKRNHTSFSPCIFYTASWIAGRVENGASSERLNLIVFRFREGDRKYVVKCTLCVCFCPSLCLFRALSLWQSFKHPPSVLRPFPVFFLDLFCTPRISLSVSLVVCFCVFVSDIVTVMVCLCLRLILLQGECLFIHTQ